MAKSRKAKAKRRTRSRVSNDSAGSNDESPLIPDVSVEAAAAPETNAMPKVSETTNAINNETKMPHGSENSDTETLDTSLSEVTEPDVPTCRTIITVGSINPRVYDGTGDIDEWLEHFMYIAKCNNWNETLQLSRIPVYLKGTAELWFRDFSRLAAETDEKLSMVKVFDGLREAFRHKNFRSMNQSQLICRVQGLSEPIHQYYYDMMQLCHRANPHMAESEKLTHIMRGIKSSILEKVLVLEPKNCKDLLNKSKSVEEAAFLSNTRPNYNYYLLQDKGNSQNVQAGASCSQPQSTGNNADMSVLCNALQELIGKLGQGYRPKMPWQMRGGGQQRRPSRTVDGRPVCYQCNVPGHYSSSCPQNSIQGAVASQAAAPLPALTQNGENASVNPDQGNTH